LPAIAEFQVNCISSTVYAYYISKLTVQEIKDKPGGAVIVRREKEKTF
jgi:hypothetical protein